MDNGELILSGFDISLKESNDCERSKAEREGSGVVSCVRRDVSLNMAKSISTCLWQWRDIRKPLIKRLRRTIIMREGYGK